MKRRLILSLMLTGALLASLIPAPQASAVTGSDWRAGNIIDDVVFYNKDAMNVEQIQSFLNGKVSCDRNGTETSEYGGGTRAQYGASRGYPAPYTCLPDYRENTTTKANNLEGRPIPAGAKSAAQIIWDAAQAHSINPQALIVILQKEQALVTDEWPFPIQYRSAMGYGCPDTAACDSTYYGFYNQVENAAKQFRRYYNNPTSYNHWPNTTNTVRWSPNAACGSSQVFIQNHATAGLYNYTPYQPNQAALNNLYGTGDGCSAYGNRNFWRLFNDWFGSTRADAYDWQVISQNIYIDDSKATRLDGMWLAPRSRYYVELKAKNMGTVTWEKNTANKRVNIATSRGLDRRSAFCDTATWNNDCNRAGTMAETSVAPSATGTFGFWITTPAQLGVFSEYFGLVMDGTTWLQDRGMYWTWRVVQPSWQAVSQAAYTDDTATTAFDTTRILPGQRFYVQIRAKNTSTTSWQRGVANKQVNVGTSRPLDRRSAFCDTSTWGVNCDRAGTSTDATIVPGATGTFGFWVTAPKTPGTYNEYFNLVMDGAGWLEDRGLYWTFKVTQPTWQPVSQAAYTDDTMATPTSPINLLPGQRTYTVIQARNTGPVAWQKGVAGRQANLGTSRGLDRRSAFCSAGWNTNCDRPAIMTEDTVAVGATGTFKFWITAPVASGTYNEYFNVVMDGTGWLNDPGLYWTMSVRKQTPQWQVVSQAAYTNDSRTTTVNTGSLSPSQRYYLVIRAKNTSDTAWVKDTPGRRVNIGTSRPLDRRSAFCDPSTWNVNCDRAGSSIESTIAPGETGTFGFWITTPSQSGTYNEYFNLVMDGVSWLNDPGMYWTLRVQ